jgi:hypothetical protein
MKVLQEFIDRVNARVLKRLSDLIDFTTMDSSSEKVNTFRMNLAYFDGDQGKFVTVPRQDFCLNHCMLEVLNDSAVWEETAVENLINGDLVRINIVVNGSRERYTSERGTRVFLAANTEYLEQINKLQSTGKK